MRQAGRKVSVAAKRRLSIGLIFNFHESSLLVTGKKERGYTPLASRQERPRGILWLVKNHPELSKGQIAKLSARLLLSW